MRPIPFDQIGEFLGVKGKRLSRELVTNVVLDSRQAITGSLFFALPGEHADGHAYVNAVLDAGGFAVVRTGFGGGERVIEVSDPKLSLQLLATKYLQRWTVPVVAVTGSNGKTSTKDLIAAVLGEQYRVHKTWGNYNNELGLPLTVLGLEDADEILVVEMGMRGLNQIAQLAKIAPPDFAVITNIGPVHLELLGTLENIAQAKGEILTGMKHGGMAVLNGDDPLVRKIGHVAGNVIYFGQGECNDLQATTARLTPDGNLAFACRWHGQEEEVLVPIPGLHNVYNCLAAIGVGLGMGLAFQQCLAGLRRASLSKMRLELEQGQQGITIINDAYNASPASMRAALDTLVAMATEGERVAILGDMYELGDLTERAHVEIGKYAASKCDRLLIVGDYGHYLLDGALQGGLSPTKVKMFTTAEALVEEMWNFIYPDSLVLVKASRGMALEQVVNALKRGSDKS